MFITHHDAAQSADEWRQFLGEHDFGQLIAPGAGRAFPLLNPAHYWFDGADTIELHLSRRNPIWSALAERPQALFSVISAYVYIPTPWNADPGTDVEWSAPTSYYAAVQARGQVSILDDPGEIATVLRRQMARMQSEGGYRHIEPGNTPFGRMLPAIRAIRFHIEEVQAKLKFGGNKTFEHQAMIAEHLAQRAGRFDDEAHAHLLRRRAQALSDHEA
jgi:transcriptional regulator